MSLFRPWVGPVDGDPSSLDGPSMELALSLAGGHSFSSLTSSADTPTLNSFPRKSSSSTNGASADPSKSFYSYYYQYYYSQLIYYASMQQQQQQQQSSSAPINGKATNCRSSSPPSGALREFQQATKANMRSDNNNNRNNANSTAETNERLQQPHRKLAHLSSSSSNRSQTESQSQSLDSRPTTSRNPWSGTNKRACEMGNQSSSTMLPSRTGANLPSGKRSAGTECRSAQPDPAPLANTNGNSSGSTAKTPSIADLQSILTFQHLFLDSLAAKKRAAKTAVDQRPKKFICTECKSGFSNRSQLNSHIRTHTGERPFVCDYKNCQKSFTRNEELTRHRRIHSGIRPYPCRWCDKRFGRKDHLRKHERTHERRLRSTILLNYTANLTGGQLFGSGALHGAGPLGPACSGGSPSSVSSTSSSSADLLAKVPTSTFGLPMPVQSHASPRTHNLSAAMASTSSNSASSLPSSLDLLQGGTSITRQQAAAAALPHAPKLLT